MVETLTVNELCDVMRLRGMKVSPDAIAQGIEDGCFPFAFCIKCKSDNSKRTFFIFRKQLEQWMDERDVGE